MKHVENKNKRAPTKPPKDSTSIGLRHIADELQVSISLVSKVLNGRLGTSGASEDMVRAIREKAQSLQYRKNRQAEALRTGQQNVIAVCVHRHGERGSDIGDDMVAGIAEEAAAYQQRLILQYYENVEQFRALAPELHRNAVDGVILGGIGHPELIDDLKAIHQRGLPVVSIHDEQLDPSFANIGMDQGEICRRSTRSLIEHGCRHIAHFIAGDFPQATARFEGYRIALREAGMDFDQKLMIHADGYSYEAGLAAAQQLLSDGRRFDGIVGQSDHHAAAALNVLVSRGWKVPTQVKLIGVDNAPFCQFAIVPLSSVSQEYFSRGKLAMRLLMSARHEPAKSIIVEPVVYDRHSSAA